MRPTGHHHAAWLTLLGLGCAAAGGPQPGAETSPGSAAPEEVAVPDETVPGIPGPDDYEPTFGERTEFEALYRIAPSPAGKRLQEVLLVRDDGESWIRSYRPVAEEFQYQEKRVAVSGRPYTNSPYVQSVGGTHFELETIALAPGETPYDPLPTDLPPPPLARTADAARALMGWYAVCVGTREGESFSFLDGGSLPLGPHSSYFKPAIIEGEQSLLAWVDMDGQLHVRAACSGVEPRCGVVDGSADRGGRK